MTTEKCLLVVCGGILSWYELLVGGSRLWHELSPARWCFGLVELVVGALGHVAFRSARTEAPLAVRTLDVVRVF